MGFARAVSANPFPFHLGPVNSMPEEDQGTRKQKAEDLEKVGIKETRRSLQPIRGSDLKNKVRRRDETYEGLREREGAVWRSIKSVRVKR